MHLRALENLLRSVAKQERADQQQADDRPLGITADLAQSENVAQNRDENQCPKNTSNLSTATPSADPSQKRGSDHIKLETQSIVGTCI